MRFPTLFILLILSCLCLALAQTSFDDCCLKYVKRMSKGTQTYAVKYRHQVTDGGCNIPAVIFTMRKGVEFCTDPRDTWVKNLMTKIDEKKTKQGPQQETQEASMVAQRLRVTACDNGPQSSFLHLPNLVKQHRVLWCLTGRQSRKLAKEIL